MGKFRQGKKTTLVLAVAVLFICCGSASAKAEKETLGFEISADYFGKYIWRGQNLVDDGVFQPAFSVSYGSLTGAIWGSIESTNINNNSGEITEVDYSLDYSGSFPGLEGVGYSIGVINYVFPNTTLDDTTEIYAGLSLDWLLSPTVTFYRDVDDAEGTYISFGLSHSIQEIGELAADTPVGLDIGASLGWGNGAYNKFYWGINGSKINDLVLTISFPMEIAGWTMAPSLNYITLLSDDVRATDTYDTASDYFFAGFSLSKSF